FISRLERLLLRCLMLRGLVVLGGFGHVCFAPCSDTCVAAQHKATVMFSPRFNERHPAKLKCAATIVAAFPWRTNRIGFYPPKCGQCVVQKPKLLLRPIWINRP